MEGGESGGCGRVLPKVEGVGGHHRRVGLEYFPKTQVGKSPGKERHHLIQEESKQAQRKSESARRWGSGSKGHGQGGRVYRSARITW